MSLITSLVFVVSAWCLFDGSAALLGGSRVNEKVFQPFITTLLANDNAGKLVQRCEATIIKRTNGKAHFLTAAECVVKKEATSYHMVHYNGNAEGSPVEVPVDETFHMYKEYNEKAKALNVAVFSTKDEFEDIPSYNISNNNHNDNIEEEVAYYQWMHDDDTNDRNKFRLYSIETEVFDSYLCKNYFPYSPLRGHVVCASRPHIGDGLSKDQIGTPLLKLGYGLTKDFTLLGIATNVKSGSELDPHTKVTEFLALKPYKSWIESLDL